MQVAPATVSAPLPAKETIKKIIERAGIRIGWLRLSATAARRFDGGFGIDVDHARFKLGGNLGELIRQLLGSGNAQRRGIRCRYLLRLLPAHVGRNNGPNQNANGQSGHDEKYGCQAMCPKTRPYGAHARIHKMTSSDCV